MDDDGRDRVRLAILKLVKSGCTKYTDIENYASVKCLSFATRSIVVRQFYKYLVPKGFIVRVSRGQYRLSEKGEQLLVVLSS